MRQGIIDVVIYEGEMFFKSDGVLIDRIDANDFFLANITIKRDGGSLDFAIVYAAIEEDFHPLFLGLNNILRDLPHRKCEYEELFPDYFNEGDKIEFVLTHPYNFPIDYRQMYAEEMVSLNLGGMAEELLNRDDEDSLEYEMLSQKYCIKYSLELAFFQFPRVPILRRIE